MIRWQVVVTRRLVSLCLAAALCSCWTEGDLVHGAFTEDQWKHLQAQYTLPPGAIPACDATCTARARFGQQLFFEPRLSKNGTVACSTCHNPTAWYVDTRAGSAYSMGAEKPTPHNTMTLVNTALPRALYGWTGECADNSTVPPTPHDCLTPNDVVHYIALPRAMSSSAAIVGALIRNTPAYSMGYGAAFRSQPTDDATIQGNVERALDAYVHRLVSVGSPFDRFIADDDTALNASATRGFALFVGKAMCAECHAGPLLSDGKPHVTGVIDARLDGGRGGTGAFLSAPLRNVARTGPYMHNGSLNTLADVIWFYRQGGDASGFVGDKDPLMQPLDITDDEAADLEAFLRALTGTAIDPTLTTDTHTAMAAGCTAPNGNPGQSCPTGCQDLVTDPANCGACGNTCMTGSYCMGGMCTAPPPPPPPMCPMPTTSCGTMCFDLTIDPMHCGSCSNACAPNQVCNAGMCGPPACSPPQMLCGSSCVNTQTDPTNCGTCGTVCPANKPTCVLGSCHP